MIMCISNLVSVDQFVFEILIANYANDRETFSNGAINYAVPKYRVLFAAVCWLPVPFPKPSRSFQNLTEKSAPIILLLSRSRKMAIKS